jgi:hypothetical protein
LRPRERAGSGAAANRPERGIGRKTLIMVKAVRLQRIINSTTQL